MLGSVVTAIALAAAASQVAAGPVNHVHHVPRGYRQDADILEDYTPYHVRYLALKCNEQHNTQFFEDCCHPLLRWQKLSDRPSKCTPSASASSAAAIAEPTSQPVDEDPIYDDDDCETTSTYHPQSTAAPSSTKAKMITSTVKSETTYKPEPTTSSTSSKEPEPSKAATPQNTGGEVHEGGFATFYYQNGNAGACGEVHRDSDMIVAIDHEWWGPDFGVKSPLCGRAVRITNTNNGKSVQANIVDVCPSCTNGNSIDMSTGAFNQIATPDEGMVPISWIFV